MCVCSLMRYNPHTYAEGTAWLSLSQVHLQRRKAKGCTLSDKRVSSRRTHRKENRFRRTRREPEPIPLRQDTKEGSERRGDATEGDGRQGRKERALFRFMPYRTPGVGSSLRARSIPFGAMYSMCRTRHHSHQQYFPSILPPGSKGGYEGRSKLHSVHDQSPALNSFQGRTDGYEGRSKAHSVHDHSFHDRHKQVKIFP